jgi:2-ketocyclohexanecarboxyl-CoA hydrolase
MKLSELTEVLYEVDHGLAWVTINRPHRYNSFTNRTIDELICCFKAAWADPKVGVIVFTGAGDKAFCTGGDQKQRKETGDYGPMETGVSEIEYFHRLIRDVPKPVIAAVNGYAIGGGQVLHVLCDITIAADHARFGQTGPRVGSFDAGYGSAYLARIIGDKRAKEIWFCCRQYDAVTMKDWGLVNQVVPFSELKEEVRRWADDMLDKSPTALRALKYSFNADSDSIAGIGALSHINLELFVKTDEAQEGLNAFNEKRPPVFSRFR